MTNSRQVSETTENNQVKILIILKQLTEIICLISGTALIDLFDTRICFVVRLISIKDKTESVVGNLLR